MERIASSYGRIIQGFHWLNALLILILLPMGLVMTRMADGLNKTNLYRVHIAIGLLVLLITVFRVIWRFKDRVPDVPSGLSRLHKFGLKTVHILLYVLLFVLTISGIGMLVLSGLGLSPANVVPEAISQNITPVFTHRIVSRLYILLFIGHLGGVLMYQFRESNVMSRMGVSWFPGKPA